MSDDLLTIITKQPYGSEDAFAGMRLALGNLVSGLVPDAAVLLIGDGTLNAVAAQRPEAVGMPSNLGALQDLLDMDAPVYCVEGDLRARVGSAETLEGVTMIDWHGARELLSRYHMVTTF